MLFIYYSFIVIITNLFHFKKDHSRKRVLQVFQILLIISVIKLIKLYTIISLNLIMTLGI